MSGVIPSSATNIASMFTYFIQREDGGPIKIGRAGNVRGRIRSMQCASPIALVCIAFIEGDWEAELHERFQDICFAGEWYHDTPALRRFIGDYAVKTDIRVPPLTPAQVAAKRLKRKLRDERYEAARKPHWFKPKSKPIPAWRAA